jgi:hypothetical protein
MEPDTMTQRMPYTLFSCIMQVRDAYIAVKLQLPLSAESLRKLNMPKWHIFPTKRSLEDLKWFHGGLPTPLFERLAWAYQTDRAEYQSILQTFLQEDLYATPFARIADAQIDLAKASATQIEEIFLDYEPQKQAKDMAYLFLSLCREAGLIPNLENRPHLSNGRFAAKDQQTMRIETLSELQEGKPMDRVPHVNTNGSAGLPQNQEFSLIKAQSDHLQLLLQQLSLDAEQLKQKPAKWVDTLKGNFNVLLQLLEEKEPEK